MFVCGGMVIGLCISHRIVDATVLHKFSDERAKASRIGIHRVDNIELSFSLAMLLPTREIVPESMYVLPRKPGLKTASKTFVFYRLGISSLWTNADNKGLKRLPSRLQFVTTVIWKALKHGRLRPSLIAHMLNLRGRTLLPISDDCYGNPIKPIFIRFFQEMSKSIQLQDLYLCWGKAVRDSHVQSQVEMIVLIGTNVGDGIESRTCLDENDMKLCQQDPDIIAFTSTQQEEQYDCPIFLRSRC
ncbi:hypothetical protein CICLE_v10021927mg [Citrus x clementina]|uniref:O-acyltransferase WSD1 C-terminal domain-containing protein n=2 Tax=Citrus clementina TaxID=85681 RepID=V4U288_CITCL|nr:hypothetical protein CICLE_v10021927mg [Citrus x clementina]